MAKKKFDVFKYAKRDTVREEAENSGLPKDQSRAYFTVEAGVVYPAVVDHIQSGVEETKGTARWAKSVHTMKTTHKDAFALARAKTSEVSDSDRKARAEVLELARGWFTATLVEEHGGPIHLHITDPNKDWKL